MPVADQLAAEDLRVAHGVSSWGLIDAMEEFLHQGEAHRRCSTAWARSRRRAVHGQGKCGCGRDEHNPGNRSNSLHFRSPWSIG
jgi:hypothetical protein